MRRFTAIMMVTAVAMATACATTTPAGRPGAAEVTPNPVVVPRPAIVSAAEWGSDPLPLAEEKRHTPNRLTIHHAGVLWPEGADVAQRTRNLQNFSKTERPWGELPYHFLIAPDGRIFEGRSLDYAPETNTGYDTHGHVGIQVWGNFEEQRVSPQQLEAIVRLSAWLCQNLQIAPGTIAGHCDVSPGRTVCPGKDLYRYISSGLIQSWVEETLAGNAPDVAPLEPLPDGPTAWIPMPAR